MTTTVLKEPTVADVIAFLSQFPPETKFTLDDPDTSWIIDHIHADVDANGVSFTGEYHEMRRR